MANNIESLSSQSFDIISEAQRKGFQFIKVYLHPRAIGRANKSIRFSGCIELQGHRTGIGANAQFSFREIKGGSFSFNFDTTEREWICYLFDDQTKGPFSPVGYNRDMLAGHLGQNIFIIKDPKVFIDIKSRNEWYLNHVDEIRKNKEEAILKRNQIAAFPTNSESIEELNNTIKFMQSRVSQLENFESGKNKEQLTLENEFKRTEKMKKELINEQLKLKKTTDDMIDPAKKLKIEEKRLKQEKRQAVMARIAKTTETKLKNKMKKQELESESIPQIKETLEPVLENG